MAYSYERDTLRDIAPRSASLFGEAPALAMVGGRAISYRELDRLTIRAAAMLALEAVRPGDRVAILSESRPEWGIASFGVARCGAAAVPILADFPSEQIGNILEHSGAKLVLASPKQRRKLEGLAGKLSSGEAGPARILPIEDLALPRAAEDLEAAAAAFVEPRVGPEDLAAIVYTSGTTGVSKGVMLSHRNYIADALACASVITLSPDDVLLSILPLAHAYEYTIGFLIPMMSGASVRYLDRPPSASVLLPSLAEIRPTIMLSVPLVIEKIYRSAVKPSLEKIGAYKFPPLRPLLELAAGNKLRGTFGGRLRFFGIGGAPVDPEVERFLHRARFPYAIGYGLTETAPIIAASAVGKTKPAMAGPALAGAQIRIAEKGAPDSASAGVGEVQVRGPMVGPGYYRDPERTAQAFTEDGYFRTGDLGSFDHRGRLYIRGRLKTMILGASGENIYPEEVEAILNSLPEVSESLVYSDERGLAALVHIKPETVEALASRVKDGIGGAEKALAQLLERIKDEANRRVAVFSRLARVEHQALPFEKTPTQKIKRFLYPER